MSKKLTILDIARLAGVGKSTVSRVLTKDPKVKPDTRKKVEQIIADSGYVPSKSAQSMRGGSQKVIGVIISRLDSPSENLVVSALLKALYAEGYDVVIMESQFDCDKTNEHLSVLKRRNVDGVIVFGFSGCDMYALENWGHRAVVIAADSTEISSVNYDNQAVIEMALNQLRESNNSNIAFIGVDDSDVTTGLMRTQAYLSWCESHSIKPNYRSGELNHESGYRLVDDVLKPETDAIVCASDSIALGVNKRLQELGRGDVTVFGVGGNPLLSFLFPNTLSIDPGYVEAGNQAASLLIDQLQNEPDVNHITLSPSLPG